MNIIRTCVIRSTFMTLCIEHNFFLKSCVLLLKMLLILLVRNLLLLINLSWEWAFGYGENWPQWWKCYQSWALWPTGHSLYACIDQTTRSTAGVWRRLSCLHELVPRALIACLCLHTSSYRSVASLPIQTALLKLRNGATHWVDRRS